MRSSWKYLVSGITMAAVCLAVIVWQVSRMRVSQSMEKDADAYQLSAQHGDATAKEKLGNMYYHGNGAPHNYKEAFRLYKESAEQGHPEAQYDIGMMYELGQGVKQDYLEALLWYQKASDLNNADAQCSIGSMYYYGHGVQQDLGEASKWFRRAADQGLARAEYDLGILYDRGRGVPRDSAQSYYWYRKAADQGYEPAERALGLKGSLVSGWSIVGMAMLFGYLWALKGVRLSSLTYRIWRIPAHSLAALLGLVFLLMGVFRIFTIFPTVVSVYVYVFIEYLFLGASVAVSFEVFLQPRGKAKLALAITAAMFIVINGFVFAHRKIALFSPVYRGLSSIDGFFLGIMVFTIAALWLKRSKPAIRMGT
jgi:Sel1 repeat